VKGDNSENAALETVFEKYAALHLQQSSEMSKRMDQLASNMLSMGEKLGLFMEVMAKSEERHNSHSEKSDRIEKVQIEQGKDFKEYKQNNDNRVVNIEKQVLLLDMSDKTWKDRWKAVDKRNAAILTTVVTALVLMYMGLK